MDEGYLRYVPAEEAEAAVSKYLEEKREQEEDTEFEEVVRNLSNEEFFGDGPLKLSAVRDEDAEAEAWDLHGQKWAETPPPPPPVVAWKFSNEVSGVLHEGRRYLVVGEASAGKSLLSLLGVLEVAVAGGIAVYLDWDNGPKSAHSRLAKTEVITKHPEALSRIYYKAMAGDLFENQTVPVPKEARLIVIDAVSSSMGTERLNENEASDFTTWWVRVVEPLREQAPDATIVLLDHPGHEGDRARGSSSKRGRVDGELSLKGTKGTRRLVVRKDRENDWPVPVGGTLATVELLADPTRFVLARERGYETPGEFRPTRLMEQVSLFLETEGSSSRRRIRAGVTGKGTSIDKAVAQLIEEGYVEEAEDGRQARVVQPYRESTDPLLRPNLDPGRLTKQVEVVA